LNLECLQTKFPFHIMKKFMEIVNYLISSIWFVIYIRQKLKNSLRLFHWSVVLVLNAGKKYNEILIYCPGFRGLQLSNQKKQNKSIKTPSPWKRAHWHILNVTIYLKYKH
jgi:hypothetical protein